MFWLVVGSFRPRFPDLVSQTGAGAVPGIRPQSASATLATIDNIVY
jgi:hypothetical protein